MQASCGERPVKKSHPVLFRTKKEVFEFIEENRCKYSVGFLCHFYGVARSGYYAWRGRSENRWVRADRLMLREIVRVWRWSREIYGSPRVLKHLRSDGIAVGKHRVARLMREHGLCGRVVRVTRRQPGLKVFCRGVANRLRELGKPTGLDQQWAGDLTYLRVGGQWRYLAVVLDLYSRKVLGWSLCEQRPHELPGRALQYAILKRRPKPGLVFHSDGGIEYRSFAYQGQLADNGITPSMNRPGKCTDNAIVESFFHTLKVEFFRGTTFTSTEELRRGIAGYINHFYNRRRMHSGIGYLSPEQFEQCVA